MKVLSLFDGIACGRLALERAGIKVERYVASEINPHAMGIAKKNWPDIEHVGSVVNLNFKPGDFDLLLAGSPCQGFSNMGDGSGFDHPESMLYFEFLRIKQQLGNIKWMLENVPMRPEWQQRINKDLWTNPTVINSSLVSAQNRTRLYWANFEFGQPQDKGISLQDILIRDHEVLRPYKLKPTPSRQRMWAYQCPNITNRFKSNCVTTKQDRQNNAGLIAYEDFCRVLTEVECERLQTLPDNYTGGFAKTHRYEAIGNGWTVDVIAHILSSLK